MANAKIIYVWDPLCGWCYAFSPVISRLKNEFAGVIDFIIISGGLAVGDRVGPVSQKAVYIKKRLPDVERIGKIRFGEKYIHLLDEGTTISDSLPPSIAFMVLKSFREDLSFEWSKLIQKALFEEGKDLNNIKVYLGIAEKHEVNKHAFMERFEDPVYKKLAEEDFALSRSWGVEKYPSLVLQKETGIEVLKKGYAAFEEVHQRIKGILEI